MANNSAAGKHNDFRQLDRRISIAILSFFKPYCRWYSVQEIDGQGRSAAGGADDRFSTLRWQGYEK
jgi:hypothetical protein